MMPKGSQVRNWTITKYNEPKRMVKIPLEVHRVPLSKIEQQMRRFNQESHTYVIGIKGVNSFVKMWSYDGYKKLEHVSGLFESIEAAQSAIDSGWMPVDDCTCEYCKKLRNGISRKGWQINDL